MSNEEYRAMTHESQETILHEDKDNDMIVAYADQVGLFNVTDPDDPHNAYPLGERVEDYNAKVALMRKDLASIAFPLSFGQLPSGISRLLGKGPTRRERAAQKAEKDERLRLRTIYELNAERLRKLFTAREKNGETHRSITVVSSKGGYAKSTLTAMLAVGVASATNRTGVLVDVNPAVGAVRTRLGVEQEVDSPVFPEMVNDYKEILKNPAGLTGALVRHPDNITLHGIPASLRSTTDHHMLPLERRFGLAKQLRALTSFSIFDTGTGLEDTLPEYCAADHLVFAQRAGHGESKEHVVLDILTLSEHGLEEKVRNNSVIVFSDATPGDDAETIAHNRAKYSQQLIDAVRGVGAWRTNQPEFREYTSDPMRFWKDYGFAKEIDGTLQIDWNKVRFVATANIQDDAKNDDQGKSAIPTDPEELGLHAASNILDLAVTLMAMPPVTAEDKEKSHETALAKRIMLKHKQAGTQQLEVSHEQGQ